MAMKAEDKMLIVAGLASAGVVWVWFRRKDNQSSGSSLIQAAATDIVSGNTLISGVDGSSSNVLTPSQIYYQSGGYAYPQGDAVGSSGQSFPLPMGG